jgi:hypothetical protein
MRKSYVKTIEEENYTLRQRVDDLDSSLRKSQQDFDEYVMNVQMSMSSCWTDGIDDYYSDNQSIYTVEDDALCDVSMSMAKSTEGWNEPVWKKWRREKLGKCLEAKLLPKWTIEYWYFGMRFQKVVFVMNKKKKHFVKIHILQVDKYNNFKYNVDENDAERINVYAKRDSTFYKKKLYSYINESAMKESFTPYK